MAVPASTEKMSVDKCEYYVKNDTLNRQRKNINFMKVTEIVRLAHMNASGVVGDQSRQSLPIPVISGNKLLIKFFFCPSLALPKQPVKLNPPNYIISLSAEYGRFEALRFVEPKQFGEQHGSSEYIGDFSLPDGMTVEAYMLKQNRLYEIYDLLLPVFFSNNQNSEKDVIPLAKEFTQLFRILSESSLRAYYRSVGDDFFCWITSVMATTKKARNSE